MREQVVNDCFLRYPLDWFRRSTVAPNLDHEVYVPIPGKQKSPPHPFSPHMYVAQSDRRAVQMLRR
jgi:hypothetical protein